MTLFSQHVSGGPNITALALSMLSEWNAKLISLLDLSYLNFL